MDKRLGDCKHRYCKSHCKLHRGRCLSLRDGNVGEHNYDYQKFEHTSIWLAEISINGHVLKNWTEITPAGTVMARFGLPAQLAIPPKANVIVNANIATL